MQKNIVVSTIFYNETHAVLITQLVLATNALKIKCKEEAYL